MEISVAHRRQGGFYHALQDTQGHLPCPILPLVDQLANKILILSPTDMLVLGDLIPPWHKQWRTQITFADTQPKLILKFWEPYWILKDLMEKLVVTQWSNLGYESACQTLDRGLQIGGIDVKRGVDDGASLLLSSLSEPTA